MTPTRRSADATPPGRPAALCLALAVALAAIPLAPSVLDAHGEAVLELASASVAAGTELSIEGADFETGSDYRLRLVGALDEHELGEVRPDADGTFTHGLRIPPTVKEGRWELIAVAPDGDVVARAPLTVTAASSGGADDGGSSASSGDGGGDRAEARDGDMPVERDRSGVEWAAIGLLVGLAGGLGAGLLRS